MCLRPIQLRNNRQREALTSPAGDWEELEDDGGDLRLEVRTTGGRRNIAALQRHGSFQNTNSG